MVDNTISIRSEQREGGFEDIWIDGYAVVFNQMSRLILENKKLFYEVIKPGAFDDVLASEKLNVKAVVDHDKSKMLGRTRSGTLNLSVDEYGLKYSILLPETSLGRDIKNMVERGDIDESSFKFSTKKGDDYFKRDSNGQLIHIVDRISGLYDVSLVVDGAYANTNLEIAKRSLEEFEAEEQAEAERKQAIKDELTNKRNYLNQIKADETK